MPYQPDLLDHPHFDGRTYDPDFDYNRLGNQAKRTWKAISDGQWHTLAELARITEDPEASISARLRDFRKEKWGSHSIERRRRPSVDPRRGIWEYRLVRQ